MTHPLADMPDRPPGRGPSGTAATGEPSLSMQQRTVLERLITRLVALTSQQNAEVWACVKHDLGLKGDLLDEPTAGLDPRGRAQMIAIIRRIVGQGRRVVISSHDIDLIYEVSDAVYVLRHGEVLAAGDPGEVFACAETMDRAGLTQPWLVKLHSELGLPLCKTEAEFFQRMHNNAIGAIKEAS